MRGTFRLAIVTLLALTFGTAPAAMIDADRVFHAALDFLEPGTFRQVTSVHVASDGTVWVLGVDWNWGGGGKWYARRLSSEASRLGSEIPLSFAEPRLRRLSSAWPIGTLPDSSLVLYIDDGMDFLYLGKVSPGGVCEARLSRDYNAGPFVDHDGMIHGVWEDRYMQVYATQPGMPIALRLNWGQPADSWMTPSTPPAWLIGWRDRPTALLSEETGRMIVASRRTRDDKSPFVLYRVDTKTLAVVDSGLIDPARDAYRVWTRPVNLGMVLVPAGESGYWLFVPTGDSSPAPVAIAYSVRRDLKAVRPSVPVAGRVRPFYAAPANAVVFIDCPLTPPRKRGGSEVTVRLKLDFTAYGSDGLLYAQSLEDSVTSHRLK
jgi:hypothetical protein